MASSPVPSIDSHDSGDEHDNVDEAEPQDGSGQSKAPALKDKECQYCHQKFTSSSLGRHLDQFLTKKKPDGIHNVDEIRRLRGGITRRTARSNPKKEQDEAPPSGHSPSPQYTLPSYSELVNKTAVKEDVRFNRANWQATGVITDTTAPNPPVVTVASPLGIEQNDNVAAGQKRSFSTFATEAPSVTTSETLRALELSLREVLDAVRTATRKSTPLPRPFEFDFESQTFSYLCLVLLPTPPTLFQTTPFATATSIPLSPPGVDQYQPLRATVTNVIDNWKWTTLSWIQRSSPPGTAMAEEIDNLNELVQTYTESYLAHVEAAYQNWMSYGNESRHNLWTIELLRAYKVEQNKVKDSKAAAERLTRELNLLQQQLDHLSRCQWPREMALWPPDRSTFDPDTQTELRKINILHGLETRASSSTPSNMNSDDPDEQARNNDRWDYDRLLSKWRKHVREDRARRTGVQPSAFITQPQPRSSSTPNQANHSPNLYPSTTPRGISLYKPNSNTGDLISRPISSGLAQVNSGESSPRNLNGNLSVGMGIAPINGMPSTPRSGSGSGSGLSSLSPNGSNILGGIPPPPRSRPLGIISDTDEYYAPRLMGLRRDPPPR